jgi:magnesium-transporting ATPase (P-type)
VNNWWHLDTQGTIKRLETDSSQGLSLQEAKLRLDKYGLNQLKEKKPISPLSIFFEQFQDFIVWVLIGAALVSGFLKEWVDALAIIAIVILNAILGFIQEYRAEKSLAALKKLSSPTSASGKARAVVAETAMLTELGKIAGMIQEIDQEATPLQKQLEQFGKWIVYLCFVLVGLVFLLEWLRGGKLIEVFLTAVSLAVAAIPEGLPAVVTIVLALGVQRMVKRHALIRKLPSVETLGCATVICSDKTGTLTKNEMTVQAVYAQDTLFKVTGVGYTPKGEFLLDGKPIIIDDYPDYCALPLFLA